VRGNDALRAPMIVAITGADGFIGRNLVRRFQTSGWTVRPVVRRDFETGSIDALVAGTDAVVHAAGATRSPSHAGLVVSNVTLTERLIDVARRSGTRRFVFISSQAAAGPAASREQPVSEDTAPAPIEAYGRSKLDAERLVERSGIPFVIVRPAGVYGPHDSDFFAMFRLASHGFAIHPANRDHWISIVHVDDLARGVELASTHANAIGRTYFVANSEPVQWRDLFRATALSARRHVRVDIEVPAWLVRAAATGGDVLSLLVRRASLLTSEKIALAAPRFWICSTERARWELGFTAAISLSDGLSDTYRWYRERNWL
jgi:nucleoside-diphosphate-sugar epimerase